MLFVKTLVISLFNHTAFRQLYRGFVFVFVLVCVSVCVCVCLLLCLGFI